MPPGLFPINCPLAFYRPSHSQYAVNAIYHTTLATMKSLSWLNQGAFNEIPMDNQPSGIYPILYSFFDDDDNLHRDAMRAQLEACLEFGAHGIALLGLITEVSALSQAERRTLIEWACEDLSGRRPLAVTIAGRSAREQIDLARFAVEAGASWLILQPPLGEKPSSSQLLRFFDAVMETVTIAVGIQNVPEILGVGLSVRDVLALHRQQPHFTVMKGEGPVVVVKEYLDALDGAVAVFNGRGGLELPDNLRAGCAGMIPAPDCADVQVRIYNAEKTGEPELAEQLYASVLPYIVFIMQSIPFHITYGKRMFAARAGLHVNTSSRIATPVIDPFFEGIERNWVKRLGPLSESAARKDVKA